MYDSLQPVYLLPLHKQGMVLVLWAVEGSCSLTDVVHKKCSASVKFP